MNAGAALIREPVEVGKQLSARLISAAGRLLQSPAGHRDHRRRRLVIGEHRLERQRVEEGLGGRRVWVDTDRDATRDPGEKFAITDSFGAYVITGLEPGTHRVRVIVPEDWRATGPVRKWHDVEVNFNAHTRRVNFGTAEIGPFGFQRVAVSPMMKPSK